MAKRPITTDGPSALLVFVGLTVAGQASTRRVWKQSAPSRRASSVGFLWVKVDCVISQQMLHSSTLDLLRRKGGGAIAFGGPRSWYCLCRLIPPSTPRDCSRDLACWYPAWYPSQPFVFGIWAIGCFGCFRRSSKSDSDWIFAFGMPLFVKEKAGLVEHRWVAKATVPVSYASSSILPEPQKDI